MTVQYLGVGGFLFYRGAAAAGNVILAGPQYSNPSLVEIVGDVMIRSDAELIKRLLPAEASEARAILVGHSHFDHAMDVPYIALHQATRADIYGSETLAHLLAPITNDLANHGTKVLPFKDDEIFDESHTGKWRPVTPGLRVAAIRSEHSPQVALKIGRQRMPFHLWRGEQEVDRTSLPKRASEWVEGTVLAYLIDFMDGTDVKFRIYYQDSGANKPLGIPPDSLMQGRPADLTIVCLGGDYKRLNDHPGEILRRTRPRFILLSHWEDFFVTQDAYCTEGGHYGPTSSPSGCKDEKGRVYGIPSAFFVEGNQVKPFEKRVKEAIRNEHLQATPWLPCPTRSVFRFPVQ